MALTGYVGEGAGTLVEGQRKIANVAATTVGRQEIQWIDDAKIFNISKNVAPLTALLTRKKTGMRTVRNQAYNHMEWDVHPRFVEIDSIADDSGADVTTVNVTSGQGARMRTLAAGTGVDYLYNTRTLEVMKVTAVSTDALTVTRGYGSSTAVTALAGDNLVIMAGAFAEGALSADSKTFEPTIYTNYCQTERQPVEISGRADELETVNGEDEFSLQWQEAIKSHRHKIESTLFHGARGTSDPTTTGGLDYYLSTNVTDINGILTEAQINSHIRDVSRRNQGNTMFAFCGETVMSAFDTYLKDTLQTNSSDNTWGVKCRKLVNSHGEISIAKHGQLINDTEEAGSMYTVNMDLIKLVKYKNRWSKVRRNIQENDRDGRKDEIMSDFGLHLQSEAAHGKLYGIRG